MTRDEKKALVEKLHGIWNTGRLDLIPEVYAVDFVAHFPKGWAEAESRDGHDGIRAAIERLLAGFPDWHEAIQDMVIDGNGDQQWRVRWPAADGTPDRGRRAVDLPDR
jgi:hypothetical protein